MNLIRDFLRLRQIISALIEVGLGRIIKNLGLNWCSPLWCRIKCFAMGKRCPPHDYPTQLRVTFEKLGPTFIKLGQVLSMRPDFVPPEYVEEFKKLQEHAPQVDFHEIKRIIETELKTLLSDAFSEFDESPLASASLGQVHRARLKKSGEVVAIKVQRPNITPLIQTDLRLLHKIAALLEKHVLEVRNYRPTKAIKEFEKSMKRELDYITEGRNADLMRYNFRQEVGIKIPKIFWDYSTSKVLTMEFISGTRMGDMNNLSRQGFNHQELMDHCTRACLLPPISHGFFHADPHPGNVWALNGNIVCYLDFGMMGVISRELKQRLMLLFLALTEQDIEMALFYLMGLVESNENSDPEQFRIEAASHIISFLSGENSSSSTLTQTFYKIISSGSKYSVYFPSQLILLAKAMVTGESMCRLSHPDMDYLKVSRPLLQEIYEKEFGIKRIISSYRLYIPKIISFLDHLGSSN